MDYLLIKYQLNINHNWASSLSLQKGEKMKLSLCWFGVETWGQNPPRPYSCVSFPSQETLIKVYSAGRIYELSDVSLNRRSINQIVFKKSHSYIQY